MTTARTTFEIIGLRHDRDAGIVEEALAALSGVVHAYVNLATETAYVQFDPSVTTTADLVSSVVDVGFDAGEPSTR